MNNQQPCDNIICLIQMLNNLLVKRDDLKDQLKIKNAIIAAKELTIKNLAGVIFMQHTTNIDQKMNVQQSTDGSFMQQIHCLLLEIDSLEKDLELKDSIIAAKERTIMNLSGRKIHSTHN